MAALQWVTFPKYAAIILRTSYQDLTLPEGLIPRSHEWLGGTKAKWNEQTHTWRFPAGATLTFGYLENANDVFRYKSSAYQFIGWEELTEFPREYDYTYLFSRKRKLKGSLVPTLVRATTNPDGIGAEWVYERFQPDQPEKRADTRDFISSLLDDNPHIDQEDYERSLKELDPVTQLQLRRGIWKVVKEGNKFKRDWFKFTDFSPQAGRVVRYWDLAATEPKKGKDPDWTVGAKVRLNDGRYYIEDIQRVKASPGEVKALIQSTAEMDGQDVEIFMEQEPGASGKIVIDDFARNLLEGYAFEGIKSTGSKEVRANVFSAATFNHNVVLIRAGWNSALVNECIAFPNPNIHDDQVDAVSGAVGKLSEAHVDVGWGTSRLKGKRTEAA
jgi:predicted phage terminase large subunit-like protein